MYGVLRQGLDCDVAFVAAAEVADLSSPQPPSPIRRVEPPPAVPVAAPEPTKTLPVPVVRGGAAQALLRLLGPLLRPTARRCREYLIGGLLVELEAKGFGTGTLQRTLDAQAGRLSALEAKVVQQASAIDARFDDLDRHQTSLFARLVAQLRAMSGQVVTTDAASDPITGGRTRP